MALTAPNHTTNNNRAVVPVPQNLLELTTFRAASGNFATAQQVRDLTLRTQGEIVRQVDAAYEKRVQGTLNAAKTVFNATCNDFTIGTVSTVGFGMMFVPFPPVQITGVVLCLLAPFATAAAAGVAALATLPIAAFCEFCLIGKSNTEIFREQVFTALLDGTGINPLTKSGNRIKVPAIACTPNGQREVFELSELQTYVRQKGRHPTTGEPMTPNQIFSALIVCRIAEKRIGLMIPEVSEQIETLDEQIEALDLLPRQTKETVTEKKELVAQRIGLLDLLKKLKSYKDDLSDGIEKAKRDEIKRLRTLRDEEIRAQAKAARGNRNALAQIIEIAEGQRLTFTPEEYFNVRMHLLNQDASGNRAAADTGNLLFGLFTARGEQQRAAANLVADIFVYCLGASTNREGLRNIYALLPPTNSRREAILGAGNEALLGHLADRISREPRRLELMNFAANYPGTVQSILGIVRELTQNTSFEERRNHVARRLIEVRPTNYADANGLLYDSHLQDVFGEVVLNPIREQ